MTYIVLPVRGSPFWGNPVDTPGDLPPSGSLGEIRFVISTGDLYYWDGDSWELVSGSLLVQDTDSIDLTFALGTLSADLRLSGDPADVNNLLVALNVQAGASPGLRAQISYAAVRSVISASTPIAYDPVTGLITYQLITDGSLPTPVQPGYEGSSEEAAFTGTGVGASGTWGNVTSIDLDPGVYSLRGTVGFAENGAVLTNSLSCGISSSPTGATLGAFGFTEYPWLVSSTANAQVLTPEITVSVGVVTTYYLNSRFWYTAGSPQHLGKITARLIA